VQRRLGRTGGRHRWVTRSAAVTALIGAVVASVVYAGGGTGASTTEIAPSGRPIDASVGAKSLWLLTCSTNCTGTGRTSTGDLIRINPSSRKISWSIRVQRPQAIAVGEGAVWLVDPWASTLKRISSTGEVQATIALELPQPLPGGDVNFAPFDVAVGEDRYGCPPPAATSRAWIRLPTRS
jgi:hypothetical protein